MNPMVVLESGVGGLVFGVGGGKGGGNDGKIGGLAVLNILSKSRSCLISSDLLSDRACAVIS